MAYDPALGKIVLFGGFGFDAAGTRYGDTWTYDGNTWTRQSPPTSPPALVGASMVFDPAINKMVLFGGSAGLVLSAQTWTYDGVTWTHESPATSPPGRSDAGMAFDPGSADVVLFGGANDSVANCVPLEFVDTWTYNGTTWHQQTSATSPSAREGVVMADDPTTGGVVLFGGAVTVFGARCQLFERFNDTWTYSRGTWSRLTPSVSPSARYSGSMAYDPQTSRLLLFGGSPEIDDTPRPETWTYQAVGSGYRFVASDGGVFAFDAPYHGSTGNLPLDRPIVGMAADPGTGGYWSVGSDGDVFAFHAPFLGSVGTGQLDQPSWGLRPRPTVRATGSRPTTVRSSTSAPAHLRRVRTMVRSI